VLLGHLLLRDPDHEAAARVWLVRERTEHEAAALFDGLAADLGATGAPNELVRLARRCADDEREHAERCWSVVRSLDPAATRLSPTLRSTLGPPELSRADRALYTSVAVGCVTESLSTALLIELQQVTTHPSAKETLRAIVKDEVRHSRLGWAHLAHEAGRRSVAWLAPHVDAMVRSARAAETPEAGPDLRAYGILDGPTVARICDATVEETIRAGFALHGIAA
jgi:hypothetical protein